MKALLCAIVAVFCLTLIFPVPVQAADGSQEEVAALRQQLAEVQKKIDWLTTQQTVGIANAPLDSLAMAQVGQSCAGGSCAVGQSYSSSSARASVRSTTGERRGLFRGRLFGGRRGGCG